MFVSHDGRKRQHASYDARLKLVAPLKHGARIVSKIHSKGEIVSNHRHHHTEGRVKKRTMVGARG